MSVELMSDFRMADDSMIVFRWDIPDAVTKYATGKVESKEFNGGGFRWAVAMSRRSNDPDDNVDYTLRCGVDHNGPWKCEVELSVMERMSDVRLDENGLEQVHLCFDENRQCGIYESDMLWRYIAHWTFHVHGNAAFEVRIRIISSERRVPLAMFDAPNNRSDVILVIGEKKLHVSREYLSVHSPVFAALFFGEYAEKGKEEIEIKDIVYEEFLELLHVIYVTMEICDRNVQHILKLTDRFQMELVMNQAKKYLTESKGIDTAKKLLLADQYRLHSLRDQCLQSFTSDADLTEKIKSCPDLANLSDETKIALWNRTFDLKLQ